MQHGNELSLNYLIYNIIDNFMIFNLWIINTYHYVSHIINLGTYFKELDKKIFGQLIIVDHAHTTCEVWSLDF
jgi:hypothetical protein